MLKDSTAVIGLGLGGMTVTYEFQERNYLTYSVNGSEQDIKSIPNAKNSMRLEGYDGLAGNRELAYEALKRNKHILKKLKEIEKKINIVIASGGGSSGSGCITFVSEILVQNPDKIVVPVILMPRQDESIQKRLNAYNVAKELMQIEELGAIIFVNNEAYSDLKKINTILVNMLDRVYVRDTVYHMANTCNFFMGACADGLNKSLQDYIDDCHKANRREVELPSIGTIAVGGAVAAISAYQKSVSEMVESAKQAGDEWESGQENLQGQIDKISELRTGH